MCDVGINSVFQICMKGICENMNLALPSTRTLRFPVSCVCEGIS